MNQEVKTINGYKVKDETARNNIDNLNLNRVKTFDNVASMKSDTTLIEGQHIKTKGYYETNDGGHAEYIIVDDDTLVDDGGSIHVLLNGLRAKLIASNYISIYQFGAKGDGITDDSDFIQNAITYSNSHNYIKIKGELYRYSAISKTIKFHAYNQIENLYLDVLENNTLTNGYMVSVNSNNLSTWDISYPNATRGYFKFVHLKNSHELSGINGIYNFANNVYEQIQTNSLDISFKSTSLYLDVVKIKNIQISNKIGTNYAVQLGYLGDACEVDTAHMYDTQGTPNFFTGFSGHNAIILKNIICNGNMTIDGGNVNITNIHSERGLITINNAIVDISNGYFNHKNPNIDITNGYVKLNHLQFNYDSIHNNYEEDNDIDINITNSYVEINNCYKNVLGNDVNEKLFANVKTNLDSQPTINGNKIYYKNTIKENYIKDNIFAKTRSAAYPQLSEKVKWRLPSGTYYYKAVPIIDTTRLLKNQLYIGDGSIALTNGDKGFRFASVGNGIWRIYRGTADNSYDKYVDISVDSNVINDDGYMCNGYKWQSREAGAIDSFSDIANERTVEYVENNIRCTMGSQPSRGTWNKGDIVYKESVGDNDPIGWICIGSGTPGTWKTI